MKKQTLQWSFHCLSANLPKMANLGRWEIFVTLSKMANLGPFSRSIYNLKLTIYWCFENMSLRLWLCSMAWLHQRDRIVGRNWKWLMRNWKGLCSNNTDLLQNVNANLHIHLFHQKPTIYNLHISEAAGRCSDRRHSAVGISSKKVLKTNGGETPW